MNKEENDRKLFFFFFEGDRKLFLLTLNCALIHYTECSMLLSLSYQLQERKSITNCFNCLLSSNYLCITV